MLIRLFMLLTTLLFAGPASAATYYLATNGVDGTCAAMQNILTPGRLANTIIPCQVPGDIMDIRGGTYDQRMSYQDAGKNGTAGNPITIQAHPGETVIWKYSDPVHCDYGGVKTWTNSYLTFKNFTIDGGNYTWAAGDNTGGVQCGTGFAFRQNTGIIFDGMELVNARSNLLIEGATNITIRNSKIHDTCSFACYGDVIGYRWYGIYIHDGSNILIENNDFYGNPGGGMQIYPGPLDQVTIRGNKIHDNSFYASSAIGGIVAGPTTGTTYTNIFIYDNLIYKNGSGAQTDASGIKFFNTANGVHAWNNTIYGNLSYCIQGDAGTTNNIAQNNICWKNVKGVLDDKGTGLIFDHNLSTDPLFVNEATFDFHLQAASTAINAGVTLASVPTDFDGNTRPQPVGGGYDIGAYERLGAPPVTYYVSALTGSDSANNGLSVGTPFKTIQKCIGIVGPGQICTVADGTYTDLDGDGLVVWVSTNRSGIAGTQIAPITIKSTNPLGAKIIVPGANCALPTHCSTHGINVGLSYYTIDGFDVSGGTGVGTGASNAGITIATGTGIIVKNNYIHGIARTTCSISTFGNSGIFAGLNPLTSVLIDNNIIASVGRLRVGENGCAASVAGDQNDHGMYIDGAGGGINGITIQRNLCYDSNRGFCLQVFGSPPPVVVTNLNVWNNTFADHSPTGTPPSQVTINDTITGASFLNNIFYDPGVRLFDHCCSEAFTNVTIDYLLSDIGTVFTGTVPAGITIGTHNKLSTSPGFVNAAARDYRLTVGSQAYQTGTNVGLPFTGPNPNRGYVDGGVGNDVTPPAQVQGITIK